MDIWNWIPFLHIYAYMELDSIFTYLCIYGVGFHFYIYLQK